MKTLLLGMGNPILSDDAIGVRLAADFKAAMLARDAAAQCGVRREAKRHAALDAPSAEAEAVSPLRSATALQKLHGTSVDIIEECSVGGLNLLDVLRGYQRVIVLDSLQVSGGTPGAWHRFTAEALRQTVHLTNIHDANFATALGLGRRLGLSLPADDEIHILAVEIEDNRTFSEQMTPTLERAYPGLRTAIFQELHELLAISTASPSQN